MDERWLFGLWIGDHEWWSTDMIPHLTGHEDESDGETHESPHSSVEKEVQTVSLHVQHSEEQQNEKSNYNWSRVVWWADHTDLNFSLISNKSSDRISIESLSLEIHLLWTLLGTEFWSEMVENWGSVEIHLLEDLWSIFVVDDSEEHLTAVGFGAGVAVRVGDNHELVVCWSGIRDLVMK
ncbi:hypothetical protein GCK72_009124 [Caenorhabditis remanei]|uniref:Uncharacterized protein n=1 Tax=Caenorhabditis remanei TaxID=31234 RepID=A0A6A5H2V8_CAERE|nr:hypothetical protein GCK72_009124 [Caenorhabditis remanei]KAF1760873.1 hypothetical protein GCK72_009124 [Caenorhabditis remanei]